MWRYSYNRGYTLLELAIVLLVIGILLGSVLVGQNFLRTAELRSLQERVHQITEAVINFRTKYEHLPGDFPRATTKWGDNASCASADPDGTPGTCNGNGNEKIDTYAEHYLIWQHLGLAGLLDGNYSGQAGNIAGVHSPKLRVSDKGTNATLSLMYLGVAPNGSFPPFSSNLFRGEYRHSITMGIMSAANQLAALPIITPEEAWQLDRKFDDGKPATGTITTFTPNAAFMPDCATSATETTALYKLSTKTNTCSLVFKTGF